MAYKCGVNMEANRQKLNPVITPGIRNRKELSSTPAQRIGTRNSIIAA